MKTTMCPADLFSFRKVKMKNPDQFGEDVEEPELTFTAGGNVKWDNHFGKWAFLRRLDYVLITTPSYLPREKKA